MEKTSIAKTLNQTPASLIHLSTNLVKVTPKSSRVHVYTPMLLLTVPINTEQLEIRKTFNIASLMDFVLTLPCLTKYTFGSINKVSLIHSPRKPIYAGFKSAQAYGNNCRKTNFI
ncbi:MAG: hypothetical protein DID90_2727552782 [Candidatus Nitrotoga sp. LAW]|nr:MAG: hypothetical protein DID90_2727552782 [Candidatus Nitrotoga sp. LAW]